MERMSKHYINSLVTGGYAMEVDDKACEELLKHGYTKQALNTLFLKEIQCCSDCFNSGGQKCPLISFSVKKDMGIWFFSM